MDDKQLKKLTDRLDMLIRLIASDKIKRMTVSDKVSYLMKAGFSASQISGLIGKPINTVTAYISRIRKRG